MKNDWKWDCFVKSTALKQKSYSSLKCIKCGVPIKHISCEYWSSAQTAAHTEVHTHTRTSCRGAWRHTDKYIKTHKLIKILRCIHAIACLPELFSLDPQMSFNAIKSKVHNGNRMYSPSVRIYRLDSNAASLTSMPVRCTGGCFGTETWAIVQLPNHT